MMQQTLNQIQQMSQKIQSKVQKVLAQSNKVGYLSPQVINNAEQQSTNHIKNYKRTGHDKSGSQIKQRQYTHSHIRQFMIEQQNQLLKQQIQQLKGKSKEYRDQIRQHKKYIKFLQDYNDSLKKQVVLWMTRPVKKQAYLSHDFKNRFTDYRLKFNQVISNSYCQNFQSTSPNTINNDQSISLNPEVYLQKQCKKPSIKVQNKEGQNQIKYNKQKSFGKKSFIQPEIQSGQQIAQRQKNYENKYYHKIVKKKGSQKVPNKKYSLTLSNKKQRNCTSCNYMEYKKVKKQQNEQSRFAKNQKNQKLSLNNRNRRSLQLDRKQNEMKTISYDNKKQRSNQKRSKYSNLDDFNSSINLRTQKNLDLCDCHRLYLKSKKF